jgi:hypothetical protein
VKVAPTRRAPLWQETLHQAILLTLDDLPEDPDPSFKMDCLIPALAKRYPSLKRVGCEAVYERPGFIQNIRTLAPIYEIDGQWFDHAGWLQHKHLQQRAQSAFGSSQPEIADCFSARIGKGILPFALHPDDPKLARKASKAFSTHMANLEAIAIEVATRGVDPIVKKRRPRL